MTLWLVVVSLAVLVPLGLVVLFVFGMCRVAAMADRAQERAWAELYVPAAWVADFEREAGA